MGQQDVQERLEMKKLGMEHLAQFNELLRYVFQVTNQDLQEVGWEEDEIEQAKRPVLRKADVVGWFDGDKLVSQMAVYPMQVNIFGEIYKMGGVTGVGTYPEYANFGLMHRLMRQSLKEMRDREQTISYLYPYSIPYYRRKGWEIISDVMTFSIKDTQLPENVPVSGMVERLDIEHEDVLKTYNRFAQNQHVAMIRDSLAWEEYWRWEREEMIAAVYYDEAGEPQGFMYYWIADDIFHMKEMVYLTREARHGLWNFISAHFSMVTHVKGKLYTSEPIAFLMEDSDITETIHPYYMARIVDVEGFFKKYPFLEKQADFHFVVTDSLLEWNQGIFHFQWDADGNVVLGKEAHGEAVEIDIQTLTTMFFGYKRPKYLRKIGRIIASDAIIKQLEKMIPNETPYFSDYF
ncbi:GNAT family N-acetyltransferase [Listeria booriae]|uniref:GNAT family N-acetyltransferase n=1 Tax=Listeria booriae TaxID=1552123 RepID=UPI0016299C54|nr:GNAT family N-acetyltransferase [Listeria booriae]MBC2257539.1 GNAT family N-acetyltransferase [Listeria booriae]